jgi:hypothetical protein
VPNAKTTKKPRQDKKMNLKIVDTIEPCPARMIHKSTLGNGGDFARTLAAEMDKRDMRLSSSSIQARAPPDGWYSRPASPPIFWYEEGIAIDELLRVLDDQSPQTERIKRHTAGRRSWPSPPPTPPRTSRPRPSVYKKLHLQLQGANAWCIKSRPRGRPPKSRKA